MTDVPTTLDAVLDPGWLRNALDDFEDGDRIVGVEEVDSSQTLAQKVRFRVTLERADGRRESRAYCVKAHLDGSPGTDLLSEAHFYGELAPRLDVRMPRAYYTAVDHSAQQAMIVMDDVVAGGGRFLGAHSPYSLDTTRDTLGQLARLHAATWACNQVADADWLAPRATVMADIFPIELLQSLLDDGRGPDVAPELRSAANVAEAMRRTGAHEITCVIHGDTHSGNSYLDADGRACWLDWQVVQRGNWATDISYHPATVLDIEDRRAHEAALLGHYLRELESLGAPALSWDAAWEQYRRSFAYGYFLWVITRISSRDVVLIHIPRLAAALSDHDTFRRLGVT
jgi:aminoglycoside phosphotransferase (APT) family kinase protein